MTKVAAAGKGTKLDSKIYFEIMEIIEQIVSIRLQSASSEISYKINYYFKTIEDLLYRSYLNRMKTAIRVGTPNEIISFLKLIDKNLSYDPEAIKYCEVEWDFIYNTNTLKIKVPTTLPSYYKVILSNLLGTSSNQPYLYVLGIFKIKPLMYYRILRLNTQSKIKLQYRNQTQEERIQDRRNKEETKDKRRDQRK